MKSKKPEFTAKLVANAAAIAQLVDEYTIDSPPKGAITVEEFSRKIRRGRHTAKAILEKSKMRRGMFKGTNGKATLYFF